MNWLSRLSAVASKPERIVAGIISGTSVDSIDTALCRIRGAGPGAEVSLLRLHSHDYPSALRADVKRFARLTAQEVAELNCRIGDEFAAAFFAASVAAGLAVSEVDLVGSHGQTVYHHSRRPGALLATLQLGDGDRIAERTGLPVFSDFRARDIAAGGEGAPITPYGDLVFFTPSPSARRVVLNLGGIANITALDRDPAKVIGFDTGPANGPLDRLAVIISNGALTCDLDGRLAASGTVDAPLLERLLAEDEYLPKPPPKSTGFETYGDEFVARAISLRGGADADLMATLTEFVARSVADAVKRHVEAPVSEVVMAGGGSRNPTLAARLRANLDPVPLRDSEEYGIPAGARESMCFALFANDALFGLPTCLPSVTGARRATTLGKLSLPREGP